MHSRIALVMAVAAGLSGPALAIQASAGPMVDPPKPQAAQLDLTQAFHARSPWRLVVSEGPRAKDYGGNDAPGALTLCLHKGPAGPCVSDPVAVPFRAATPDNPTTWEPHYLLDAKVVYPHGPKAAPLLMIVTGSLNAGDGGQVVATQLVAYAPAQDAFRRVFVQSTGRNNNQEIRFVADGPLRGDVIVAEPQAHAPFGYWIAVLKADAGGVYRPVLRYGSATRYNDGNPLSVIDSETPNIERRLGLWKPGAPLPVPQSVGGKPCLKPTLKHTELWCG